MRTTPILLAAVIAAGHAPHPARAEEPAAWESVALAGDGLAEALGASGWLDAALCAGLPERRVSFRCIAWGGDSILPARDAASIPTSRLIIGSDNPDPKFLPANLNRLRPFGYESEGVWLDRIGAATVILCAGRNEALDPDFTPAQLRDALQRRVSGLGARGVVLVTPVLVEPLPDASPAPDAARRVAEAAEVIRAFGAAASVPVADVLEPDGSGTRWPSLNGTHPAPESCREIAHRIAAVMGARVPESGPSEELRATAARKHRVWMQRYRPLNFEYIVGRRASPFGVKDFPPEMATLEEMARALDEETHRLAGAKP